ncbi:MAG: hypothetical protein BGO63_03915 [Candidatus Accumulibacter sp. 66-26]|nr:MAG: hypothetical protein BGO63_03915 [Candidatus Accumulibacter sp. 66-26]
MTTTATTALHDLLEATQDAFQGVTGWAKRQGLQGVFPGLKLGGDVVIIKDDARVNYLLAFPDAAAEQVEALIDSAIVKHQLLLTPKDVVLCFARSKEGLCLGKVVDVDVDKGLVLQSLGKGRGSLHCIADLGRVPKIGEMLDVVYRAGKATERAPVSLETGRGR